MFTSARIKLTFWYLLIIMGISFSFSTFVYRQLTDEVRRSLRMHSLRIIPNRDYIKPSDLFSVTPDSNALDVLIFEDVRRRILLQLLIINGGIGVFSALAGYFLAGKTLRPIEIMVDDQKRFVADASHELRTPLTAMKTEIEVALQEKDMPQKEAKQLLVSNLEEIDRMQKLANYLLKLSKYQDTKSTLPREQLDFKDVTEKAVERIDQFAKEKKITITTKMKNIRMMGNTVSLIELMTILLDNSIKYTKSKTEIIVRAKLHKNMVKIEVQDFGIGMKSSEIPYIFNRFYRADSSRNKSDADGYGLGLSIAKNIVDLHHGKIDVISELSVGTTFYIELPAK